MTPPISHLTLPFFDDVHQPLGRQLAAWVSQQHIDEQDDRRACREWVQRLGRDGWLRYCVPAGDGRAWGGALPTLDSHALVVRRETLAPHSPLADFAFAMQGLGSGATTLAGAPPDSTPPTSQPSPGAPKSRHLPSAMPTPGPTRAPCAPRRRRHRAAAS